MAEEMKNPESEEDEKKPESPEAEKPEEKKEEPPKGDDAEEKAPDDKQADENGEGAESEGDPEPEEKAPPDASETDRLKAENLTLKTQLEALKIGFRSDCIEDAVVLAESIVKRDGSDITVALQAVAKKYPDWKFDGKDNSKGGFKVGADTPKDGKNADDSRLDAVFGIRKKK